MNEDKQVVAEEEKAEKSPVRTSQEPTQPPKLTWVDDQKVMLDVSQEQEQMFDTFGTDDPDMVATLQGQALSLLGKDVAKANGSLAMLHGISPRDALEGMLATQMVAVHNMTMEMSKRTLLGEQTVEGVNSGINRVTKLMRTFTAQMEALQKHRTKGQQTIQVQHVQVNDGGQAIIGDVKTGGGGNG